MSSKQPKRYVQKLRSQLDPEDAFTTFAHRSTQRVRSRNEPVQQHPSDHKRVRIRNGNEPVQQHPSDLKRVRIRKVKTAPATPN